MENREGIRKINVCELALKLEDVIKARAKAKQELTTLVNRGIQKKEMVNPVPDAPLINTNEELGKLAGVGHTTMHQYRVIMNEGTPELQQKPIDEKLYTG